MENWEKVLLKERKNKVQQLLEGSVKPIASLMVQIHLWMLHVCKNFKFHINARGPYKAVEEQKKIWRKQ